MLDARFPFPLVYDSKLIGGKITQTLIIVYQAFQDGSPGILVAPVPPPEEVGQMETAIHVLRVASYSRARTLNWQFLVCWLIYFALGVTTGCSLLSFCVL
jgi:hypothetical protein